MKFRIRNTEIVRCSACRSRCMRFVDGWLFLVEWVLWIAFCFTALEWTSRLPLGWWFLASIVFFCLFDSASNRLYHAIWAWRHPTRCQGGGQLQPQAGES